MADERAWRRYRKRPLIVQARGPVAEPTPCRSKSGPIIAPAGSYIIREQDGDGEYPCAPETFAATYEPVEEGAADADR